MACSKTDVLAGSTPPISKIVFFCQTLFRQRQTKGAETEYIFNVS